jgi:hypothetical protein
MSATKDAGSVDIDASSRKTIGKSAAVRMYEPAVMQVVQIYVKIITITE